MENSRIGWTHHTMNFWWGCTKVNRLCRHCYIGPIMQRAGQEPFHGPIRTMHWEAPFRWQRKATAEQKRFRIFTCSMSDFFHPGADEWREEAWDVMRHCPDLDWLILTKRPELIPERLPPDWGPHGFHNVWLGVSSGSADTLSALDLLGRIPAKIRFVSCEPLLEKLDLKPHLSWLNWVISGCERAGKSKRHEMHLDWVREIDLQCHSVGVPHFFKQAYLDNRGVPCERPVLDGRVVQEFPGKNHNQVNSTK